MKRRSSWVVLGAAFVAAVAACGQSANRASEQTRSTTAAQTLAPQDVPTHGPQPIHDPTTTVAYVSQSAQEQCKVTNQNQTLACNYDLAGADLGITVYDPDTATSWVLFGNSNVVPTAAGAAADPNAWETTSDAIGYYPGILPANLCGGLDFVTIPSATSPHTCPGGSGGQVFAPDPVFAPRFVARGSGSFGIGDFVFHPVVPPVAGDLPPYGRIPGSFEVPSGAFYYAGSIYAFYTGAPEAGDPSVSYLTTWTPSQTVNVPFSPTREVISKVDYSLDFNLNTPPPTGWVSPPPIDGNFVQIAPVVSGGYLYMFGTGAYRKSWVHLARMPWPQDGSAPTIADYLVNSPGFEVLTSGGTWSSSIAEATALFTDDPGNKVVAKNTPDVGELSVQVFDAGGRLGNVWLMMYTPKASFQVLMRWATSPGDLSQWSPPVVVFDATGMANQGTYCCTGSVSDPTCTGQQFMLCSASGPYAPYILPSITSSDGSTFSVSYLLSSFIPYGTQLMTYDISLARPCAPGILPICQPGQTIDFATCSCVPG